MPDGIDNCDRLTVRHTLLFILKDPILLTFVDNPMIVFFHNYAVISSHFQYGFQQPNGRLIILLAFRNVFTHELTYSSRSTLIFPLAYFSPLENDTTHYHFQSFVIE